MKKRLLIVIIPVVILLAGPWVIPAVTQWSAINDHRTEINIKTGQARHSHRLWCVTVSQRVEDTVLSKILGGETVDLADIKPWHTVYLSWPGKRIHVHYAFHGALAQAREIEVVFELLESDAQRKRQVVRDILKLWQTHGDYFEAERYLAALSQEMSKLLEPKRPGSSPEPNAVAAKEQDALGDRKYQQALECYTLLHEQPEPESCWSRLLEKERLQTLSKAEEQMVRKLRSFARDFGLWGMKEAPDPVVSDKDQKEVEAVVTRICTDPTLKSAYRLPEAGSWDRLMILFFRGNRCYVEMYFNDGYAYYVHLFKYQGNWEVLLTGYWME